MTEKEIINCPACNAMVSVINRKIVRHERGLGYVPYKLYHKMSNKTGTSIGKLRLKNLCNGSGLNYE